MSRNSIKQNVVRLLHEYRIESPPIPVEKIALLRGATVRYVPFEGDISGMLFRELDKVTIGVNSLHPKTRQRFTIAHEIGHLELHDKSVFLDRGFRVYLRNQTSSNASDIKEIEANNFAAELLMPQFLLERELQDKQIDIEKDEYFQGLAHKYQVSLQALLFRLYNLGIITHLNE